MASAIQAACLADVSFRIIAEETNIPYGWHRDLIYYVPHWFAYNRQPAGTYAAGSISVYEGVACEGTSGEFTAAFMHDRFWFVGGDPPASWATAPFATKKWLMDQVDVSPDSGFRDRSWDWLDITDRWQLRPWDVAVLANNPAFPEEIGEPYHYVVIHSVGEQSGIWYATSNKGTPGDEAGYYEELTDGAGLIGCFRYNGKRPAGTMFAGFVQHSAYKAEDGTEVQAGLYMPRGYHTESQVIWDGSEWVTISSEVVSTELVVPLDGVLSADIRWTTSRDSEGHGAVRLYVDGELLHTWETNWVVPLRDMVSSLYLRLADQWESTKVGQITATLWLGGGGGESAYARYEDPTTWQRSSGPNGRGPLYVRTADGATASRQTTAVRDWLAWDAYRQTHTDINAYVRQRDLFGCVTPSANGALTVNPGGYLYANDGKDTIPSGYWSRGWIDIYLYGLGAGGGTISATEDRAARTAVAYADREGEHILCRRIERPADRGTWGDEITVWTGSSCRHPALAAYDDGSLTCWYMGDNARGAADGQRASRSTDGGRTWQEITGMMGSNLRNLGVCQHHGITLGVGIDTLNQLRLVRSNDQGLTEDAIPGSDVIASSGVNPECRPDVLWYPDGSVAVWAEDEDSEQVCYVNANAGYGAWTKVS